MATVEELALVKFDPVIVNDVMLIPSGVIFASASVVSFDVTGTKVVVSGWDTLVLANRLAAAAVVMETVDVSCEVVSVT